MTEIGEDKIDTIKQVSEAKKKSIGKAGLRKADDGSIADDKYTGIQIPEVGNKSYSNELICDCDCHSSNKKDCAECYDHPIHLKENRKAIDSLNKNEPIPEKNWWNKE